MLDRGPQLGKHADRGPWQLGHVALECPKRVTVGIPWKVDRPVAGPRLDLLAEFEQRILLGFDLGERYRYFQLLVVAQGRSYTREPARLLARTPGISSTGHPGK
jgi:hypothetical protein